MLRMLAIGLGAVAVFGDSPAWVEKSNRNAEALLEVTARFNPESAGQWGIAGVDGEVVDLKPEHGRRRADALREAGKVLQARLASEQDPQVRQDLEIMIEDARRDVRFFELQEKYFLPYGGTLQTIFGGVHGLLDDQVAATRRPAALIRLRRYAGMEAGYTPALALAERQIREKLNRPGLLGPATVEVNEGLAHTEFFLDGIGQLFAKYKIAGYEEPLRRLREQAAAYDAFIRKAVLPRSRSDFRLPREVYDFSLERYGVDIPAAQLTAMAHAAYAEILERMKGLALQVAKEKGFRETDYRGVIRELKKDQWAGDAVMPNYEKRLAQVEEIIRRERLVTLPDRPARMVIASAAETAQQPAPHMQPPRLIGNTGERGEFVLPLNMPTRPGEKSLPYDDFSFAAASWTMVAHEVRPGHELQFDAMVERGVSLARSIYAFNSTNVEGWGLYSEYITLPFMPADGQLISLQYRLMRAARAFLDPELHMGKITPAEALRVLREDVVLSEAMAKQEVERYTFRSPAQATSYFYGYTKLLALRREVEKALGPKFDALKFHDFILSQGLLPPAALRKAVLAHFTGARVAL